MMGVTVATMKRHQREKALSKLGDKYSAQCQNLSMYDDDKHEFNISLPSRASASLGDASIISRTELHHDYSWFKMLGKRNRYVRAQTPTHMDAKYGTRTPPSTNP